MGPLTFGKREEQIFLGGEIAQRSDYSEDTALRIDQEVKRIVTESYQRALQVSWRDTAAVCRGWPTRCCRREVLDAQPEKDLDHRRTSRWTICHRRRLRRRRRLSTTARARKARPGFVPPLGSPLPQE